MAQQEEDREDLLAEATALVERIELSVVGANEPVVAGFRRDGSFSIFFGAARVYQFNRLGKLRRAYVDGLLYKAERGRLFSLRRERTAGQSTLWRSELAAEAAASFIEAAAAALGGLRLAITAGTVAAVGQHPAEAQVLPRVERWLGELVAIEIADSPRLA